MPTVQLGAARIHYTEAGDPSGFPVLAIAPGGMRSEAARWSGRPWDPLTHLPGFRVIAMDQRNAGASTAPVRPGDGWHSYTTDQLNLMDHLGISSFHVAGMCIGGAYIAGLLRAAPARVRAAVMLQPIGLDNNRPVFEDLFDAWADDIRAAHPEASEDTWAAFRAAMFGGDFLFNASREEVAAWKAPILLLRGDDPYHPASTSDEIAALSGVVRCVREWKAPEHHAAVCATIRAFLAENT